MNGTNTWMLPEGIEELLPGDTAWRHEQLRRTLLDRYRSWGYDIAVPPLVEYLDALTTGHGDDLELQTVKFVDQLSGRLLGVRADITPQAARIDAHHLRRDEPVRLCYVGPVLRADVDRVGATRNPLQVGVELFDHAGVRSDLEVFQLMLETLDVAGITEPHVDLGHVGIFRALIDACGLSAAQARDLHRMLQCKALPDIHDYVAGLALDRTQAGYFEALGRLNGDHALARANDIFADAGDAVRAALAELNAFADAVKRAMPGLALHFDLAELRGLAYHTGVVFAAFVPGFGHHVAVGGRYDHIGEYFGRARPATGFSADLKTLVRLGRQSAVGGPLRVLAPATDDAQLRAEISRLRIEGAVVIQTLPGQRGDAADMGCTHVLRCVDGAWRSVAADA